MEQTNQRKAAPYSGRRRGFRRGESLPSGSQLPSQLAQRAGQRSGQSSRDSHHGTSHHGTGWLLSYPPRARRAAGDGVSFWVRGPGAIRMYASSGEVPCLGTGAAERNRAELETGPPRCRGGDKYREGIFTQETRQIPGLALPACCHGASAPGRGAVGEPVRTATPPALS